MANKLLQSSFLSTLSQMLNKSIGLISTIIIARILTPEDFGVIAIISIAVYFFDVLSNAGGEQYLIQKTTISKQDINTMWSINLLLKLMFMSFSIIIAPFVAEFLGKLELALGIQVASIVLLLNSLIHPKLIVLKRQLKYKTIFRLSILQKVLTFSTVLPLAIWLKNYWAFIVADIVGSLFLMVSSRFIFRSRSQFSIKNFNQQWQFTKWMLGKNLLGYCRSQIDVLYISKMFSNKLVGNYNMAKEIAMLPGHHMLAPAIEPLLASLKKFKNNQRAFLEQFYKAHTLLSIIGAPICVFTYFQADLIVNVLLGEQWSVAGEILSLFSLLFFYWVNLLLLESALTAQGKVKLLFKFDFISLLVTVLALTAAYLNEWSLLETAQIRVLTGILLTLIQSLIVTYQIEGSWLSYLTRLLWPLLMAMTINLGLIAYALLFTNEFITLTIITTLFLTIYLLLALLILNLSQNKIKEHKLILALFPKKH